MEMQDMLADRLKQKRALSHASLEEYSKELGISKSALQKYEAGTGFIPSANGGASSLCWWTPEVSSPEPMM